MTRISLFTFASAHYLTGNILLALGVNNGQVKVEENQWNQDLPKQRITPKEWSYSKLHYESTSFQSF